MEAKKRIAKNNKGFTIAEFLVAFGIMGVIVTTVGYMMTTSSKTYSSLSTEAQLQSEAQLVANAISELAIDSFDAGNVVKTDDYATEYDAAVTDKSMLVLLSRTKTVNTRYQIRLNRTKKELELYSQEYNSSSKTYGSLEGPSLLGQYIDNFEVTLDRVKDENIISFRLVYTKNGRSYTGDYQVLMRNRAYADPDAKDAAPDTAQLKSLTLTPKLVYIDIIDGVATQYYTDSITSTPFSVINGAGDITFEATPIYKGTAPADAKTTWSLLSCDTSIFSQTADATEATKNHLKWNNVGKEKFISTPNTEFSVVAAHGTMKKESRVRLRIVRKITWAGTTGISGWKSEYSNEVYRGTPAPDTQNYAAAGTSVTLIPSIDQSNVSTDLTWKLYRKNTAATSWVECTEEAYAKLASTTTSGGRQSNTITIGKNVSNTDEFKVEVVSVFDNTVKAEYIFGILPKKTTNGNGDHSRGYKLNFNDWATDVTRGGYADDKHDDGNFGEYKVKRVTKITGITSTGPNSIGNSQEGLKRFYHPVSNPDDGQGYIYVDMNSFGFKITQMVDFYQHDGMDLIITFEYVYDVYENQGGKKYPANKEETRTGTMRYKIKPVKMEPLTSPSICLQKGRSMELNTRMHYYNVTKRGEWGIYVSDDETKYSSNLNRAGMEGTNEYLSFRDTSSYGNAESYNDLVSCQMEAKASTRQYPTDYLTVRVTSEDYFNRSNGYADSYYNYKVYIANVEGQGVYIPGPNSKKGSFPAESSLPTDEASAVTISGISTTGGAVSAKVYKSGSKIKCVYGAITYTYNKTYEYWKK